MVGSTNETGGLQFKWRDHDIKGRGRTKKISEEDPLSFNYNGTTAPYGSGVIKMTFSL